jgi:hypothetical protein
VLEPEEARTAVLEAARKLVGKRQRARAAA